jgi:SAM-dependent methyltransferase
MARRRLQQVPWKTAGRTSEVQPSADDVVRRVGWVFNNETGSELTAAEFVATGDEEVGSYLHLFGLDADPDALRRATLVEIGSGIGRMTAAFTRRFAAVVACDLDAAFLERCRQTVAEFGEVARLRTSHVDDGRSLRLGDVSADVTFSYITLQHCAPEDALALVGEAVRVTRPGGTVALNLRRWTWRDLVLVPAGAAVRASWRLPRLGPRLAGRRWASRLGWQANRLAPDEVLAALATAGHRLDDVEIIVASRNSAPSVPGARVRTFEGLHPSHWWLVGRRASDDGQ